MGTFSPTHWFIVFVMITPLMALLVVPTWRILQRAGFNGAWALLMLVPLANFMLLWFVAFLKWPNDREGRTSTSKGGLIVGILLLPLALGVLALLVNSAGRVGFGDTLAVRQAPSGFDFSTARPAPQQQQPKTLTYEEAFGLPAKR
jgi:hypothetical protein